MRSVVAFWYHPPLEIYVSAALGAAVGVVHGLRNSAADRQQYGRHDQGDDVDHADVHEQGDGGDQDDDQPEEDKERNHRAHTNQMRLWGQE